ncbi:hypothetical protein ACFL2Q_17855 [Thermodesulfobacteriota bacterium]
MRRKIRSYVSLHLKRNALELHGQLQDTGVDGLFHISTNMCPAHRKTVLAEVRQRLADCKPCRLVSTQCVEAGVDLDFPTVFREWGPLDSIAQAAGRCNRNGTGKLGRVWVFRPQDEKYPDPTYRRAAQATMVLLSQSSSKDLDINSPETFQQYYRYLYKLSDLGNPDAGELGDAIKRQDFSDVAKLYRLISQQTINVLVPYDEERFRELEDEFFKYGLTRNWIARARPHSIGLFKPGRDDPVLDYLNPVPVGGASSDDWFIYSVADHYHEGTGLVPPESMECLIA